MILEHGEIGHPSALASEQAFGGQCLDTLVHHRTQHLDGCRPADIVTNDADIRKTQFGEVD